MNIIKLTVLKIITQIVFVYTEKIENKNGSGSRIIFTGGADRIVMIKL